MIAADSTLVVALGTAVIVSVLAPLIVGSVANRAKRVDADIRRIERREDLARQDEIAAQLARTRESSETYQREVLIAQEASKVARVKMAETLVETKQTIAETSKLQVANQADIKAELVEVKDLGIVTHALVNSDKTAAMKREVVSLKAQRVALMGQLAMAAEIGELKTLAGRPPSALAASAVAAINEQVATLDSEIADAQSAVNDRLTQQYMAEAKTTAALAPGPVTGEIPVTYRQATDIHVEHANITVAHEPDKEQP